MWFEPIFFRFFDSFLKNAVRPQAGEPQDYGSFPSPPAAAKNVRANLRIVHHFGYVKDLVAASLRSAAKLNGNLKEKINFWFRSRKRKFSLTKYTKI